MGYFDLGCAIIFECIGINALKASNGLKSIPFDLLTLVTYVLSFIFLAMCLKTINLDEAYAVWSAIGTVLITISGVFLWHEAINIKGLIGIALIIVGVVLLNLSTK
ncbi:MAG: multidrug efflux SMR transporter [Candidatus Paralactobacillus gallistercoris]|uniref:Multidrug efflux SMR transporter n=1 Tax=Candidatus Paralactobacillus gallistercoris TaxID=2838724 RepID=A0A948TIE8_9LACO|nr:multidrug efflux SMR transporter [Candidatus Paralactobacillus gallistercoris]